MKQTILITGANGGVGNFIAQYLLEKGERNLVLHYRNNPAQIKVLLEKYDLPFEKHSAQADLTNENDIQDMVKKTNDQFGPIHTLANVAGMSKNQMSWKIEKQDFLEVINGNLLTSFLCSKAVIPQMRENKFGRIINFASIVGFTGVAGASHYCAAKAGLIGLTKALSLELVAKGITVNAISLGYFNAGLLDSVPADMREDVKKKIPTGRFGEYKDVGAAVSYICSEDASFYTGQVLQLNGGQY